jgi:hypothetical protein
MEKLPKIIAVSEKIYGKLLRLYPQSHQHDYAELMAQLFRDQCRDAWRQERSVGLMKLWLRVLPDIGKTSVMEQIAAIERNQIMKYLNAKNSPTILLIAGLALGLFSFTPMGMYSHGIFQMVIIASSLAILTKAIIELFRPSNEWLKIMLRTLVLMFVYALFMPAWAKLELPGTAVLTSLPRGEAFGYAVMICLFANPIVAAMKLLQFLIQRRKTESFQALA